LTIGSVHGGTAPNIIPTRVELQGTLRVFEPALRERLLATTLVMLLVAFSIATIWPPQKKIALGLDIQGGTSFLIRLMKGEKDITKAMLEQAVEVIRKRVDYFGAIGRARALKRIGDELDAALV